VHFDSIKRTIGFRAIDPKVDQGWLRRNAKRLLESRVTLDAPPASRRSDVPLDPFITKPQLAKHLYEKTEEKTAHIQIARWLDPSAGTGSFYNLLPPDRRLGIDIRKQVDGVIEHDFLSFSDFGNHVYGTIGNPPFGKGAPLEFFNRAARISAFIAFIVPASFNNPLTINKIDPQFHLIHEEELPHNSFLFGGQEEDVPAIFQIWEKRAAKRDPIRKLPADSVDLEFLRSARSSEATIWFQRLGVNAGRVKDPADILTRSKSPKSHFFIRCDQTAANILRSINWHDVRQTASGPPNISQAEIIEAYNLAKAKSLHHAMPAPA
jgi:predicted RNA methylase